MINDTGAESTLRAAIEGDELVIRVGVNRIDGHDMHPTVPSLTFDDRVQWVEDVRRAMFDEEEDGASPIGDLLDRSMTEALEQGSIGVAELSATHVGTCQLCGTEFAALRHSAHGQVCAKRCAGGMAVG